MKKINKYIFYLFFILIAFFNFQYNFLGVAGTNNFYEIPSSNGEIETTDGILYGHKTGRYVLGRFERENFKTWQNPLEYRNQYLTNDSNWYFSEYLTSYGLQVKIYGFLAYKFNLSLSDMHKINSLIYAAVIVILMELLHKYFSYRAIFFFGIAIIFSPWNIIFAKDIRWVQWSWYLPILSILFIDHLSKISENLKLLLTCILVMFFFILKFLISYEFISTLVMLTISIYIFINVYKKNTPIKKIITSSLLVSLSTLIAFLISIIILVNSKSHLVNYNNILKNRIYINLGLVNPIDIYCDQDATLGNSFIPKARTRNLEEVKICKEESLKKSNYAVTRVEVVLRYLIFRNLLPWIGNTEALSSDDFKSDLKRFWWDRNYSFYKEIFYKHNFNEFLFPISIFIQTALFLLLICTVFVKFFQNFSAKYFLVLMSFFSSLSWFILAKEYSYIHLHLCYVVWTVSFIPFSVLILFDKKNKINSK